MLTAQYRDTGEIIDITRFANPRLEIDQKRICCRFCRGAVGIRHGVVRVRHFYHRSSCTSTLERHPESPEHNLAKELVAEHVKSNWSEYSNAKIVFEYPVPEAGRIADVAMVFPSGWVVAHEIQLAGITNENLQNRTDDYNRAGVDVIWWLGKSADTPQNRAWCQERFEYVLLLDIDALRARLADLRIPTRP